MTNIAISNNFRKIMSVLYRLIFGIPSMYLGYLKDRLAYYKTSSNPIVNNLKKTGIHIFESPINQTALTTLQTEFEKLKINHRLQHYGQLTGRIYSQGILTPILDQYIQDLLPHLREFFNTNNVKVEISYYQESYPVESVNDVPGGEFHVDDNKANVKYFIYLSDVNQLNGPFCCVPESNLWRLQCSLWRGLLWELTRQRYFLYGYLINAKTFEKREKTITGLAGTHFLVDTTALHRAQPVLNGYRKVLVISFNRVGFSGIFIDKGKYK